MELIGLLDSPYVRRVAIGLQLLGLPFRHRPLSVFRDVEAFKAVNPVVKAPTLVCDDGSVLMDSTLILDHAESLATGRSLLPPPGPARLLALRRTGLALAAAEKAVQIVYERRLRPPEKQHAPWTERVGTQLVAACAGLEQAFDRAAAPVDSATLDQAALTAAVMWRFIRDVVPDHVDSDAHPALTGLSDRAERLAEFIAAPSGDGICRAAINAG